jgi:hypothetical protein
VRRVLKTIGSHFIPGELRHNLIEKERNERVNDGLVGAPYKL